MVRGFERLDDRDGYLALPASRPCVPNHGESIEMRLKVCVLGETPYTHTRPKIRFHSVYSRRP